MAESTLDLIMRTRREGTGAQQAKEDLQNLKGGLSDVEKAIAGTRTTIGGLDRDISLFGTNIGTAADLLSNFGINIPTTPMDALGQAISFAREQVASSIADWTAYAREIKVTGDNLGITYEETSRIIQAADDYGVETENLTRALERAARMGFAPTIENLANLSDEILAIQDPTERATKLNELFGRQWADIGPFLLAGGDAIRDATAAIDDNLIVTEEASRQAEEYRLALDEWNDSLQGIKNEFAQGVLPTMTDAIQVILKSNEAAQESNTTWTRGVPILGAVVEGYHLVKAALDGSTESTDDQTEAAEDATAALDETTAALDKNATAADDLSGYYSSASFEAAYLKQQEDELKGSLDELQQLVAGPVGQELESFQKKQDDLQQEADEWKAKIDELNGKEYLTQKQKEELAAAETKYGEVSTAITENADAHDEATKRILYNMLQQQLAIDGWTKDEFKLLTGVAEKWGLIDESTGDALDGMQSALEEFAKSGDVDAAIGALDDVAAAANRIPRNINIKVKVSGGGGAIPMPAPSEGDEGLEDWPGEAPEPEPEETPRPSGGAFALGGSFVAPPGYLYDDYLIGVSSGEMVTVSRPTTINNYYNLTANYRQMQSEASLGRDVRMLATIYGGRA